MELVTRHDVEKMNFNAERREIKSVSDYMRMYLKILQMAFEYNLISLEQRDGIANSIMVAVQRFSKGNDIVVSNYIYVISMRILSISNYDAFELMQRITNQEEANKFVLDIKEWYLKRIKSDLEKATKGYRIAHELKDKFILSTWKSCYSLLKQIHGCLEEEYTGIELKSKHADYVEFPTYTTIQGEEGLTYLDKIESYLRRFEIETSILIKLQAEKMLKAISEERKNSVQFVNADEVHYAQQEYDAAVEELAELDAIYAEMLEKASKEEAEFCDITDEFDEIYLNEHPDYDEDDREQYEQYLDELEAYLEERLGDNGIKRSYDDIEIEYRSKRDVLKKKVATCMERLYIANDEKCNQENMLEQTSKGITLTDFLKEYTIMVLAQNGKIAYPGTPLEKNALLENISVQMAAKVFLQNEETKTLLTTEEREYLNT